MPVPIRCLIASLVFATVFPLHAVATVVKLDIAFGVQPAGSIYVDLLETEAPLTVANFLDYVDDGNGNRRYDGTFFHRKVSGFVIQGGGYAYNPALGEFGVDSAVEVPEDPPVVNEFDPARSNVRGTLAMAKVSGDPDSATSQWFINQSDNSANLDGQNGGFTVFGRVLGNGMELVDAMDKLGTVNVGSPFGNLPVADISSTIDETNLIVLAEVVVDPPATISAETLDVDFGLVAINSGAASKTVTLQNVGSQDLVISTIGDIDPLAPPFRFAAGQDNCSGQTLASTETCTIGVEVEPAATGNLLDSFNVSSSDAALPDMTVTVRGIAVPDTPVLETQTALLDFGDVGTGQPVRLDLTVSNFGGGQLRPVSALVSGLNADPFSIVQNNCDQAVLDISESCVISVQLTSFDVGALSAVLDMTADPGGQVAQVTLGASVTLLEPKVRVPPSVETGDVRFDDMGVAPLSLSNQGLEDDLYISRVEILGADAALFTVTADCIGVRLIAQGSACLERVDFNPVVPGEYSAVLRVHSNDPVDPVVEVPLNATASQDDDGVTDSIERGAPNGGDGNNDGVADILQSNVASLPNEDGNYVSIQTSVGKLASVRSLDRDTLSNIPTLAGGGSLAFADGFFGFVVEDVPLNGGRGGSATVTIHLPEGSTVNSYFKFGRVPGESFLFPERWYLFPEYNPDTGIGAEFEGNKVILHLVDGGLGDNDLVVNGRINDPGAPASLNTQSSGSGGGGGCVLRSQPEARSSVPLELAIMCFVLLVWRWCGCSGRVSRYGK